MLIIFRVNHRDKATICLTDMERLIGNMFTNKTDNKVPENDATSSKTFVYAGVLHNYIITY